MMIYYTQILFIKPGKETVFHAFEDQVLPLLQRYGGELVYRIRPPKPSVLVTTLDYPYELHIVTFPTKSDFRAYRDDPNRTQFLALKDESISRVLLIEGELL